MNEKKEEEKEEEEEEEDDEEKAEEEEEEEVEKYIHRCAVLSERWTNGNVNRGGFVSPEQCALPTGQELNAPRESCPKGRDKRYTGPRDEVPTDNPVNHAKRSKLHFATCLVTRANEQLVFVYLCSTTDDRTPRESIKTYPSLFCFSVRFK
ncbi:hypothetical protein HZH66_002893 [Vespula vulgaris]|uniref:Uncharacterized protein n=1 Tax=Vespula vulgaris TaxID=7454 RepID=A0A834KM55_VESVU|nr:hypothetical protein HZH66_002893 [Vespula vulgaris]